MIFWSLILLISTALVLGIAVPLMRIARASSEIKISANRIVALGLLAVAPIAALAIYLQIGAPEALNPVFRAQMALQQQRQTSGQVEASASNPANAIAALPPEERAAAIESMVDGLATRVEENPDDVEGLRMLARSYGVLGRAKQSADAYGALVARDNNASADDWHDYASALVSTRGPDDASFAPALDGALNRLLEFNEADPLALFYLGLSAKDAGNAPLAITYWQKLKAILPADAPIFSQLDSLISQAEAIDQ